MAPPIVNPYNKSSPSSRTTSSVRSTMTSSCALPNSTTNNNTTNHTTNPNKRPERPWEAEQPQWRCRNDDNTPGSHEDPFDDGGMDWDQATRVLDAVRQRQQPLHCDQQDGRSGARQQQPHPRTNPYQKSRPTSTQVVVDSHGSQPLLRQSHTRIKTSVVVSNDNVSDDPSGTSTNQKVEYADDMNNYSCRVMDPRKNPSPGCVRGMDPRQAPSPGTAFSLVQQPQPQFLNASPCPLHSTLGNGLMADLSFPITASVSYGPSTTNNYNKSNPQRPPRPPTTTATAAANRSAASQPAVIISGPCVGTPEVAAASSQPGVPPPRTTVHVHPRHHDIVASLRPAAWKTQSHEAQQHAPTQMAVPASPGTASVGLYCSNNPNRHNNARSVITEQEVVAVVDPLQKNLPRPLQFTQDQVQPVTDEYRPALVQHAALTQPLLNGWTLFSHQKRAILAALLMRRMILALDMGLGKTLIGCCWARAFVRTYTATTTLKVVVICPVSLKKEWQRTLQDAVGLTVFDDADTTGTKKQRNATPPDADVILVSWAKVPAVLDEQFVVVADEAHSMQSMTAARTRDALQLMLASNCIGVLLLTGTPMKNGKPANLFPLLRAVQHPLGRHQRSYEAHFCGGRDVQYGRSGPCTWQATGATNLEQLRALTQSHLLHLTKADCLKTLPPQTRVHPHVPVSRRAQMQHTQALQKLARAYNNNNNNNGKDHHSQDAILGAVQNLRMVDSLAKVEATVQTCLRVLEKEPAVVVFTSFQQVAKLVHQKLSEAGWPGELLTGETPPKKRQGLVDNFQSGLSSVFVSTFGAGGVGLTLTAAHTVVLLDRPWTPGDAHQAEDRVRRIGQTHAVTSIWMSAFELDEQIDSMLESKAQTAQAVLAVSNTNNSSDSAADPALAKLSIFKLLQSVLPPPSSSGGAAAPITTKPTQP